MLGFMGAKAKLDRDDFLASSMLGAMECVGSGITTIGDTVGDWRATVQAATDFGLRTYAFVEIFGMDDARLAETVRTADERIRKARQAAGPLVTVGLSPHAPYTVSGPLYRELNAYGMREGLKLMLHVAESQAEVAYVRDGSGVLAHDFREKVGWERLPLLPTRTSPVKYLEQWDALDGDVVAVHCVQVSPEDVAVLKKYDIAVAHCPKSNAKLGCGIAPVSDFIEAGLRVGIGTDSLASNNILDMFDEMRMVIFLQRARQSLTTCLGAAEVLRMATLGGAEALGLAEQVGSLQPGKRADVIAVDMEHSHFSPIDDPVSALVYGANQEDVFFTMIDGRVVYDRKVFSDFDTAEIKRRATDVRTALRN